MRNKYDTLNTVFHLLGSLFIISGIILLIPLIVVTWQDEITSDKNTFYAFLIPSILSFILAFMFNRIFRPATPNALQAMLVCALGWIVLSAIGAIPFVIALKVSYINAYFETMSGFTTTGITVFTDLQKLPKSILMWRSLMQWVGGLGIITFFLAVAYRGKGAHKVFVAESHKIETARPVPSMYNTIKILWSIYIGFTILLFTSLYLANMNLFDSICHALCTISTGGFSPYDASIFYYNASGHPYYRIIEYIIIAGMMLGGINFLIHYRAIKGDIKSFFDNMEMKYWWGLVYLFLILIMFEHIHANKIFEGISLLSIDCLKKLEEIFRVSLFQVIAILTSTGFATQDITSGWFGPLAKHLFLAMMLIGGCVGSTAGGFKILRIGILFKIIKREIFLVRAPAGALSTIIINKTPIKANELFRVSGFFFIWILFIFVGGCIIAISTDYTPLQSISGMFSAMGNTGPCFIPTNDMGQLPFIVKIVLIIGMLAGRLEILPVLLLFSGKSWKS